MGYKVFGFVVWRVLRVYLRRRVGGMKAKAAVAGAGALIAAGAAVAARQAISSDN